jgi:hypothetical protein
MWFSIEPFEPQTATMSLPPSLCSPSSSHPQIDRSPPSRYGRSCRRESIILCSSVFPESFLSEFQGLTEERQPGALAGGVVSSVKDGVVWLVDAMRKSQRSRDLDDASMHE